MAKITVQNTEITVVSFNSEDYISLTDMAKSQLQEHIIFRWLSLKSTIEYLGEWEMLYNPAFNCTEFGTIKNMAMFGMTARQWREANPELMGNIRDYATINELICLSNMENINAVLINDGVPQGERLVKLNQIAIQQMRVLNGNEGRNLLK